MKDPRAVELVRTWNYDEYVIIGYWDGEYKHDDNITFTKNGAIQFCREHGYIICTRP